MSTIIKLSFSVQNGAPYLDASSENPSPDAKARILAGKNLQQVISSKLQEGSKIEGVARLDGNNYIVSLSVAGRNLKDVRLNSEFIRVISAQAAQTSQVALVPPPPVLVPPPPSTDVISPAKMTPLNNPGTNCFMNAIFQVFMQDPKLKEILVKTYPESAALKQAIENYEKGEPFSLTSLRAFMPEGHRSGQQDAAEFFDSLMEKYIPKKFPNLMPIQTTTNTWVRKEGLIWKTVAETKVTSETVPITYIPLEITKGNGQALIEQYFSKQTHEGEPYKSNGQNFDPESIQIKLQNSPERLIFQLKRFTKDSKNTDVVDMPATIEVNGAWYTLKSIVVHLGNERQSGHYISAIHVGNQWMKANDSHISKIVEPTEERRNGYMYFYEKIQ